MQKKVLVRADGGKELGLGHWFRCLFLLSCYREATSNLDVSIFTRNTEEFKSVFPDENLKVIQLEKEESFIEAVGSMDVVLLDGYNFRSDYFLKLKLKEAFIIYVDDLISSNIDADIIINHTPGTSSLDYTSVAPYTCFFLGGNYSMIPELFQKSSIKKSEKLNNLLLCMGGADPFNQTAELLEEYKTFIERYRKIYVVVGQQYQYKKELTEKWGALPGFQILNSLSKHQIAKLMQECGIAILPASTMAIEYAHVGGMLGIARTADNQEKLYEGLLKEGVAIPFTELLKECRKEEVYDRLVYRQNQVFDNASKERFIKLFKEVSTQQALHIRKAKKKDAVVTFSWASDKQIRKFSFSKKEISWEDHQRWFFEKLEDENCLFLIAALDDLPIGSIRFDIKNKEAVISYLIDSDYHGRGLGRIVLAEGIKALIRSRKNFEELVGFVLEENKASVRIFERLGFERLDVGKERYYKKVVHGKKDIY